MSSRHTRRKLAKANAEKKLEGLAKAALSARTAAIVRKNKSQPIERNYFKPSLMGRLGELSHRGYVAGHSTGSIPKGKSGSYRFGP